MKAHQNVDVWLLWVILRVSVFRRFSELQASHRAENLTVEISASRKKIEMHVGCLGAEQIAKNFREAVGPRPSASVRGLGGIREA